MSETINLVFYPTQPTMLLLPTDPAQAPAEFVNVLVGAKGDTEDVVTDQLGGFSTDPMFYYLLESN